MGGVQVTDIKKTSETIQWTDGATNGNPILHYTISGRTRWNNTWMNLSQNVEAKEVYLYNGRKEAAVENVLSPWSGYEFRVPAANALGYGPPSAPSPIYNTPADVPHKAPSNVGGGGGKIGELTITWDLKYWKEKNREEDAVYYLSCSTRPWAIVVGLEPDTYYYVKVMAYNSAGEGPESERFLERTYRKAPQKPPSTVQVFGVNPTTVKVRIWEIDQDMSTANDTIVYVSSKLEAYVDNLSPGKIYYMRVLAFSNGGDGRMSSPALTFQMVMNIPPPPKKFYVYNKTIGAVVAELADTWAYIPKWHCVKTIAAVVAELLWTNELLGGTQW
ncbi:contactin-like [Schistocerca gregaria]|uniref:contactin-like n=1 Tax=Schistocerca gregaria TaxID=7010 RepID=UPI00211E14B8|nr:contactin-like [Schistocerca gregaria]